MKSLLFLILFLPFTFSGCSGNVGIVSDICEVTQEICSYANLICEHFGLPETSVQKVEPTLRKVSDVNEKLQTLFNVHSKSMKVITQEERDQVLYDLIAMRNYLKNIYYDLK